MLSRDFVCEGCRNDVIVVGADREVIRSITHCIECKPEQSRLGVDFVISEPTGESDDDYRDFD